VSFLYPIGWGLFFYLMRNNNRSCCLAFGFFLLLHLNLTSVGVSSGLSSSSRNKLISGFNVLSWWQNVTVQNFIFFIFFLFLPFFLDTIKEKGTQKKKTNKCRRPRESARKKNVVAMHNNRSHKRRRSFQPRNLFTKMSVCCVTPLYVDLITVQSFV
jgi:hypothetical protein